MANSRIEKKHAKRQSAKSNEKNTVVSSIAEEFVKAKDIAVEETKAVAKAAKEEKQEVIKAVKKSVAKKEIKTSLYVEYYGKQVSNKEMISAVKKAWTKGGHKIGEIKSMELYVKPEEASIYYVINKTETGRVDF